MIPPFGTTKNFFVVENHRAKIVDGVNITDRCTHNNLCIHVKDPRRLVNWLEVTFKRSHAPIVTTPQVTQGVTGSSEILTQGRQPHTFFTNLPVRGKSTQEEQRELNVETTREEEERNSQQQLSAEQIIILDSLLKGVTKALKQEQLPPHIKQKARKYQEHDPSSQLTAMFRGITEGIMGLPEENFTTKLDMLTKVVETFVSKNMTVPSAPTPIPPIVEERERQEECRKTGEDKDNFRL